jgi:hypothetical protein
MGRLKCETPTKTMGKRIQEAAEAYFEKDPSDAFFEHGQWWVRYEETIYSVCDAVGGDAVDGFTFERVS